MTLHGSALGHLPLKLGTPTGCIAGGHSMSFSHGARPHICPPLHRFALSGLFCGSNDSREAGDAAASQEMTASLVLLECRHVDSPEVKCVGQN
jgi:hypothetical protein